jgi:hypothetical protein
LLKGLNPQNKIVARAKNREKKPFKQHVLNPMADFDETLQQSALGSLFGSGLMNKMAARVSFEQHLLSLFIYFDEIVQKWSLNGPSKFTKIAFIKR